MSSFDIFKLILKKSHYVAHVNLSHSIKYNKSQFIVFLITVSIDAF